MTKPTEMSLKKLRQIQNRIQLKVEYNQKKTQLLKGTGSINPFGTLPVCNTMKVRTCFIHNNKLIMFGSMKEQNVIGISQIIISNNEEKP